jgi:hypothetical protein
MAKRNPIFDLALLCLFVCLSLKVQAGRIMLSLDGDWQIAEGKIDATPGVFEHKVPVPGLVSLAKPRFDPPPGPKVKDRESRPQKDLARDAFWYRRTFQLKTEVPAVAVLKVRKAMFGTRVFLNGQLLGDHLPSFTPGYFNAKRALKKGENELIIRIGADRDAVGTNIPTGFDFEKQRYIPGIYDSVNLIISGTPHFTQVQTAPDITNQSVRVQAILRNDGDFVSRSISFVVREAKSGKIVGRQNTSPLALTHGAETNVDVIIPIQNCRLWSPEDPFLYKLEADSGADSYQTRFGMREFRLEPAHDGQPGRAWLNGKPYFLRGSNFAFNRFLEDDQCGNLPWQASWVRLLHQRVKEMHWNCLRYCIGFPPEAWYDTADELGILIQDEFPFWGEAGPIRQELAVEYAEWMRERWNHPCVVIWDAQNETRTKETCAAIETVRPLDLSHRPWDNGWGLQTNATDSYEWHCYHFYNPTMRLAKALTNQNEIPDYKYFGPNAGNKAIILNEYGWLWLNRDGTPTTLTRNLYDNLAGTNAPPSVLFPLYARLLAAETEYWRCRRQVAGVMEFCSLSYSRSNGQTSDHWSNVEKLKWGPEFYRYVRDAFAPVGLMVDFFAECAVAGQTATIPVIVINDLKKPWQGKVSLRLLRDSHVLFETNQVYALEAYGKQTQAFGFNWPPQTGACRIEAMLTGADGNPVRSVRDVELVATSQSQSSRSLKTATSKLQK